MPRGNGHPSFNIDGTRFGNLNPDGTISIFDTSTWEEIVTMTSAEGGFSEFFFGADPQQLFTSDTTGVVSLWSADAGEELYAIAPDITSDFVDFTLDARYAVFGDRQGQVSVWDVVNDTELHNFAVGAVDWVSISSDATQVSVWDNRGELTIWPLQPSTEVLTVTFPDGEDFDTGPIGLAYAPDGSRFVSASVTASPIVWDASNGAQLLSLNGHTERVWATAWSADGTRIATGSVDTDVIVWDAETGESIFTLSGHEDSIYGLAFSPDSTQLASSSADSTVRVWDVATGELQMMLEQPASSKGVAWSADGTMLAAGTNIVDTTAYVTIWDSATGEQRIAIPVGETRTATLAFSPDGSRIVVGLLEGERGSVFDTQTGENVFELAYHEELVGAVAYSHDGTTIATGSGDGTTRLWDAETGAELSTLFTGGIGRVAFSPDDRFLATQNLDGTTRI